MAKLGSTTVFGNLSTQDLIFSANNNSKQWNLGYTIVNQISSSVINYNLTAFNALNTTNSLFVFTVPNSATNGQNLLTTYRAATALTPNGLPLSSTNRAVIFLTPGSYGTITGLNLNTQYVDIVGLSTDPSHVVIDLINQTANDVRVSNITNINCNMASNLSLTIWNNCIAGIYCSSSNPFSSTVSGTFNKVIFSRPNGFGQVISGTFNNCSGTATGSYTGGYSWGTSNSIMSGKFNNCVGTTTANSYGPGGFAGSGTLVSGTFTNCVNYGYSLYNNGGGGFLSIQCNITGVFFNCIARLYSTTDYSGGGAFVGNYSTITGSFIKCTGYTSTGFPNGAFVPPGYNNLGNGKFINCFAPKYEVGFSWQTNPSCIIRNFMDANGDIWNYN